MNEETNNEKDSDALGSGKTEAETESGGYAKDDVPKGVFQDSDDLETFDEAGAFQSGVPEGDAFEPEETDNKDTE